MMAFDANGDKPPHTTAAIKTPNSRYVALPAFSSSSASFDSHPQHRNATCDR